MIISHRNKATMLESAIHNLVLARTAVDAYAEAVSALARSYPGQLGEASKHIRSASEHVSDVMFAIKGEIGKESAHAQA